MLTVFTNYLHQHGEFTDNDIKLICSPAKERFISKKDFLLREGDICRYKLL